ncbi:MAG: hypothetical protein IJE22_08645 [Oscillibacter sp.]|nr:hypothetical protein [Oscillibacter sp.]
MAALTFVHGIGSVAMEYGLEESIFLDTIIYWAKENKSRRENFRDGRWWTYNSVRGFAEMFPWWSEKQIRRIANSCVEQGALVTANYNKDGRDRTIWYSPNDPLLALYGEDWSENSICPNGQMHLTEQADSFAQTGEPLPCNNPCKEKRKKESPLSGHPKEVLDVFEQFSGEDKELREACMEFLDYRVKRKKPILTTRAANTLVNKLKNASKIPRVQIAMIDNAIERNWTSVFPLKPDELAQIEKANQTPAVPRFVGIEIVNGEERDIYA